MKNKTIEQIITRCIVKKIKFDIKVEGINYPLYMIPILDTNIKLINIGVETYLSSSHYHDIPLLAIQSIKC